MLPWTVLVRGDETYRRHVLVATQRSWGGGLTIGLYGDKLNKVIVVTRTSKKTNDSLFPHIIRYHFQQDR